MPSTPAQDCPDREPNLVARIRAGDEIAFEALFREHYPALRRFAISILHRRDEAEDVVQAVFLGVWAGHETWEVRATVKAYLFAAVHHRALQLLRQERVRDRHATAVVTERSESDAFAPASGPDEHLVGQELEQALRDAVHHLAPRTRQAFELRRYERLSYAEIATAMGISEKTVGVHIGRALMLLRQALAAYLALQAFLVSK